MDYKSYKLQENMNESNRFNGIRVNVYYNHQGQYAFIELGKTYNWLHHSAKNIPDQQVLNHLFKISVDSFEDNKEKDSKEYKYSLDFIAGIESAFGIKRELAK